MRATQTFTPQPARNAGFLTETIRRDLARHFGHERQPAPWRAALGKKTFAPVFTLRHYQHWAVRRGPLAALARAAYRLMHRWACGRLGIDLPLATRIGPGFRIIHGYGLVVNALAEIGEDVTVFQGVTIGQRDVIRADGRTTLHARIGNRVTLSPYAQIVGAAVGDGATVAPLTVVHRDVAPATIVGGNPMRVLKEEALPDVRYGQAS
jgi:serine O-acetyltransferase